MELDTLTDLSRGGIVFFGLIAVFGGLTVQAIRNYREGGSRLHWVLNKITDALPFMERPDVSGVPALRIETENATRLVLRLRPEGVRIHAIGNDRDFSRRHRVIHYEIFLDSLGNGNDERGRSRIHPLEKREEAAPQEDA